MFFHRCSYRNSCFSTLAYNASILCPIQVFISRPLQIKLATSHVVFNLFTFRQHKIFYNRDKFPCDITVGIKLQAHKKIPVKFLDIPFKKNKQKYYLLIISRNLRILMKCSFIDICVIIIFKKKSNFLVTARDLIFY